MIYHVTIARELTRTQSQTITVESTDAQAAYDEALTKLDADAWHTDVHEVINNTYQVECICESGWEYNFTKQK